MTSEIPVAWARYGLLSRTAAWLVRPKQPPVLILSLARSGSSWVGRILGTAPDALYLREPFTQGDAAINARIVFDPGETPDLEPTMRRLADKAILGFPEFKTKVVHYPEQWALRERRSRRVVLKEVNPRAAHWLVERYQPKVLFLLRHPAAVCWSAQRQSWLGTAPDDWRVRGREDGESLRRAWEVLKDYPSCEQVFYETLCRKPIDEFRRLYAFAGLTWNDEVTARVVRESAESAGKSDAWRRAADPEAIAALREGFEGFDLDWFRGDSSWRLDRPSPLHRSGPHFGLTRNPTPATGAEKGA